MSILDDGEPDPFFQKKEWVAFQKELRLVEEASPGDKIRQKNIKILSRLISFMIYPEGPYRWKSFRLERKGYLFQLCHPSEAPKSGGYPCNSDFYVYHALQSYCLNFRNESLSIAEEKFNLLNLTLEDQYLINEACELTKWPYKLGAALYIEQQMVAQKKCKEPSQGKAQWLVAKAPITPTKVGDAIPLRPDGGEPSKIGNQWKKYRSVAHFWAAFVVWAEKPLGLPNDRFLLLDFICNADVDKFLSNAALFRKFRADVEVSRTKKTALIKQFGGQGDKARDDEVLEGIVPSPPDSIPDFLDHYQWAALEQYKTRTRGREKRVSEVIAPLTPAP